MTKTKRGRINFESGLDHTFMNPYSSDDNNDPVDGEISNINNQLEKLDEIITSMTKQNKKMLTPKKFPKKYRSASPVRKNYNKQDLM